MRVRREQIGRARILHLLLLPGEVVIVVVERRIGSADDLDRHNVILLLIGWLLAIVERNVLLVAGAAADTGHELESWLASFVAAELLLGRSLLCALNRSYISLDILDLRVPRFAMMFSSHLRLSPILMLNRRLLHILRVFVLLKVAFLHPLHWLVLFDVIVPVHYLPIDNPLVPQISLTSLVYIWFINFNL